MKERTEKNQKIDEPPSCPKDANPVAAKVSASFKSVPTKPGRIETYKRNGQQKRRKEERKKKAAFLFIHLCSSLSHFFLR